MPSRVRGAQALVHWGVATLALEGQTESGDLHLVTPVKDGVLVAVADGLVIGFVDASLQRYEDQVTYGLPAVDAYVEELIVTSAHRRRGVASTLIRALEA